MDLYRQIILDHYKNPRNFGHLNKPDVKSNAFNASCGDSMEMEIKFINNRKGEKIISQISFSGTGCAISQAAASLLTEKVKGMELNQVLKLKYKDISKLLKTKLTPSRVKCATLSLEVMHQAVNLKNTLA